MAVSTRQFITLFALASLALASAIGFLALVDSNYRLKHVDTTDSFEGSEASRDYQNLNEDQQQIFAETIESGKYVAEEPFRFPDRVVRNGTYYHFSYSSAVDWTNPITLAPAGLLMGALGGIVAIVWRDMRS